MLVKVLSHALASGADYEKTLKTRRNLSVLGMVLGLVVLVIVNLWTPDADLTFADFLKGCLYGNRHRLNVILRPVLGEGKKLAEESGITEENPDSGTG